MSVYDREGKDEYAKWGRVAKVGEREQAEQRERWNSTNVVNSINIAEYYRVVSKVSPPSSALVQ